MESARKSGGQWPRPGRRKTGRSHPAGLGLAASASVGGGVAAKVAALRQHGSRITDYAGAQRRPGPTGASARIPNGPLRCSSTRRDDQPSALRGLKS